MRKRAVASCIIVALGLTGCTAVADGPPGTLPQGVSLSVYQTRTDVAQRRLEVAVRNDTDGVLTITGLVFDSPQFMKPVRWAKESTTIRPGTEVDLPVLLSGANCAADDSPATVTLDYVLEGGRSGTASAVPTDRIDRLPELRLEDCIAADAAAVAELRPPSALRFESAGGSELALIDLAVNPTGADGQLVIESALSTTLLEVANPVAGTGVDELPLGITIDGDQPESILTIAVVPGRCDPHAIAEDKRGTILPLKVTAGGVSGVVYLPSEDGVRAELYAFVKRVCGLPRAHSGPGRPAESEETPWLRAICGLGGPASA